MARKRMLSPEMFTSATVCALPVPTRWTWAGMLCYLDDYGKGEDSPELVKAAVWPRDSGYTAKKVAVDIGRLVDVGALCRYECCGKPQIHAPSWSGWQKVSHPTDTKLCPCPLCEGLVSGIHRERFGSDSGAAPRSVVKENLDQRSSRDGEPSDPTPEGSDGLAAAKAVVGRLGRASA
jgi:hypothetical protein